MTETTAPTATEAPALPPTAAQRYWDENKERLEAAIEDRKTRLDADAQGMKTGDLRALIEAHNAQADRYNQVRVPNKTAGKDAHVEAYVAMHMKGCDEQKAMQDARYRVSQEEGVEYKMRSFIADRDKALDDLREQLAKGPGEVLYRLEWSADSIQSAIVAARTAEQYLARRAEGMEPADLAKHVVREAMNVIRDTAASASNLRMDSHGLHRMAKAAGYSALLSAVGQLLDEDTQALLGTWF